MYGRTTMGDLFLDWTLGLHEEFTPSSLVQIKLHTLVNDCFFKIHHFLRQSVDTSLMTNFSKKCGLS